MNTSVVLLIHSRPDATRQVVEALRRVQPRRLFVVADGARSPQEAVRCAAARAVIEEIDWPCEVVKDYSDLAVNMGIRRRVVSGLTQVFAQVESAIILEDDCVPDATFFGFCEELLDRYQSDNRVMMITGTNPMLSWQAEAQSYHFSYQGMTWGWATWRRAWQKFDPEARQWRNPEVRQRIHEVLADDEAYMFYVGHFEFVTAAVDELAAHGRDILNTWDYQWSLSCIAHGGLTIVPAVNLVSNIGFERQANHTTQPLALGANLPRSTLAFPLRHPAAIQADRDYDHQYVRWRRGRPEPTLVVKHVQAALDAHHPIHALLLIDALMQVEPDAAQIPAVSALRTQALGALALRRV